MPKPPPTTTMWKADYRVSTYDPTRWQRADSDIQDWVPVAYADVPDEIWSCGRQGGWKFYTLRQSGSERGAGGRYRSFTVLPGGTRQYAGS
jgi:hypothetical protein